jgi:two-component system response regulator PilR (NtrC family)
MAEILIVDDDEIIRDTLHELLSSDYHCETAETAERALEKLKEQSFDLILTDISMPGLSGLQLLERVLKDYPETPVIIVSGMRDHEHAQELISLGAFDSVVKPFRLEVVEGSVRRAINYRSNKTPDLKLVQ